ncbi:hypothetical protein JTE90_008586 [Oedothorax gibbosus]|uniref:G protein-coupled receptor n=1 Tax=Oedothorax gibbosus TaxID=931172 RepID=A0AAV6U9Y2_9ARAC|nr:hypothetical protein JTE90_008586 [Oedothorax gibbosus]
MSPEWDNCTIPPPPTLPTSDDEQRIYVLLATSTAMLSFTLNFMQFLVIICHRLLRSHLVIGHLCICGQLASASVLFYIWRAFSDETEDYFLCLLLPSCLHLLVLFTFGPLITLLVLQHHRLVRDREDAPFVMGLLVTLVWCQAFLVSLVPLTGWNNWQGLCRLALVWPPAFSLLVCVLYFLHYPMVVILLADHCFHSRPRRRSSSVSPASSNMHNSLLMHPSSTDTIVMHQSSSTSPVLSLDEDRIFYLTSSPAYRRRHTDVFRPVSIIVLLLLYFATTLPFVFCTAWQGAKGADPCDPLVAGERAVAWTSWITVMFAALRPCIHLLMEDEVTEGTITLVSVIFKRKLRFFDV